MPACPVGVTAWPPMQGGKGRGGVGAVHTLARFSMDSSQSHYQEEMSRSTGVSKQRCARERVEASLHWIRLRKGWVQREERLAGARVFVYKTRKWSVYYIFYTRSTDLCVCVYVCVGGRGGSYVWCLEESTLAVILVSDFCVLYTLSHSIFSHPYHNYYFLSPRQVPFWLSFLPFSSQFHNSFVWFLTLEKIYLTDIIHGMHIL